MGRFNKLISADFFRITILFSNINFLFHISYVQIMKTHESRTIVFKKLNIDIAKKS